MFGAMGKTVRQIVKIVAKYTFLQNEINLEKNLCTGVLWNAQS